MTKNTECEYIVYYEYENEDDFGTGNIIIKANSKKEARKKTENTYDYITDINEFNH